MKIGIYSGSFNPIHFGHIGLGEWVLAHTDLDEVWLLVTPNNPLKDTHILADEKERYRTVAAALKGKTGLYVSDFEFTLPRPSYTVDTLRALTQTYPQHSFTLIIGQDNWQRWGEWKEGDYILTHYRVMVYPRHGSSRVPSDNDAVIWLKDAPYFDISSTEIRQKENK